MSSLQSVFQRHIQSHITAFNSVGDLEASMIELVARCIECFNNKGKILLFGNGGSAADAQHIAAEFVVRYKRQRKSLPAMALTSNSSVLTAHTNDFEFETVFQRQVHAFARPEDVVIGISTSGSSLNVCLGLQAAQELGAYSVALIGPKLGEAAKFANLVVNAPGEETARIQEVHIFLGHFLCDMVDQHYSADT